MSASSADVRKNGMGKTLRGLGERGGDAGSGADRLGEAERYSRWRKILAFTASSVAEVGDAGLLISSVSKWFLSLD